MTGSIEQALNTLLSSNGLFLLVLDERTIVVAQDSAPNRLKYERQVALTIPLSYADATELATMLTAITRTTTGVTIPPVIVPNKTNNTITVRATEPVVAVIRELVLTNDKPRAEITLDVEILEVSRSRTKELGLNLSQNQIGGIFSPEQAPPGAVRAERTGTTDGQPFNLNTITQGVSTADFYLTVPQAIVKFLQTDVNTRFLAKTQLRGSEGAQLSLKVGADEPYLTTSFSPNRGGRRERQPAVVVSASAPSASASRRRPGSSPMRATSCSTWSCRTTRSARPALSAGKPRHRFRREASRRNCGCATASRTCSRACCRTTSAAR